MYKFSGNKTHNGRGVGLAAGGAVSKHTRGQAPANTDSTTTVAKRDIIDDTVNTVVNAPDWVADKFQDMTNTVTSISDQMEIAIAGFEDVAVVLAVLLFFPAFIFTKMALSPVLSYRYL